MSDFKGKTIIITGAGKGIGRACVELFSQRGAHIIAMSRSQADLDELAAAFDATVISVDLADNAAARAAIKKAGPADALINCAGTNVLESVLNMTEEGYEQVLGINLRAALICAQEFARARIANGGGGTIINVTSIAGHRGFVDHVAYAASKAGLEGATRVMAKELGAYGIRVNAVAPTVTMTELAAKAWSDPAKRDPMLFRHPMKRFAEVDDVARSIAMLVSDDAPMISGAVLPVDGGFLSV